MFNSGLRPYQLAPLDRGCVNTIVLDQSTQANCDSQETPTDLTNKKLYFTVKLQPWDDVADDSDAVFKILGALPNPDTEPGRVVFSVSATQSYIDPTVPYYYDIVQTDIDGTNPERLAIGSFNVIAGANNEQAGGGA